MEIGRLGLYYVFRWTDNGLAKAQIDLFWDWLPPECRYHQTKWLVWSVWTEAVPQYPLLPALLHHTVSKQPFRNVKLLIHHK